MDWYFDFISPFAYLQHELLLRDHPRLQRRYRPVLFAAMLKHWGGKGPAEIEAKRALTYRHCQWLAERHEIAMKFPPAHPFNPLPFLRLALARDCDTDCVTQIFRALYAEGADPNDPGVFAEVCARAGLDANNAAERINAPQIKTQLRESTDAAIARGVFGVPTLALDNEDGDAQLFWGLDMTEMALECLAEPRRFRRGEYARLAELPVAQARKA
ncbi:MAG: 2-hydroxychromene-2-carboxylate isomerase [Gammaproteobacteria bacterium]|nr:2-hydroxychromene-2-carboxylate isomerase [Gammaproteobacteria bacterium]